MPVERKSFTRTEIRAGIFVLLAGVVLILFIGAILRFRPTGETKTFQVVTTNTQGLDVGADVRFGGMIVGRVLNISPDAKNHSELIVKAEVAENTPVNEGSQAYVGQVSLTSEMHLEITTGKAGAPLLKSGARIPATTGGGLFGNLPEFTETATKLLENVQKVLGVPSEGGQVPGAPEQKQTLVELMATLDGLISDMRLILGVTDEQGNVILKKDQPTITVMIDDVDKAIQNSDQLLEDVRGVVDENRDTIREALESAKDVAASANQTVDDLNKLIADNRGTIDDTLEGTRKAVDQINELTANLDSLVANLQDVLQNNEPALSEMIDTLNKTLRNLEDLSQTLRDQPQSLIRGVEPVGRR